MGVSMHIPRFLILPLLISVCVAAQPVPGNVRKLGNRSICIEPGPQPEPPAWMKEVFPRRVSFPTTAFRSDEAILKRIISPPELRAQDLTRVDANGVSPPAPHLHPSRCITVYVDENGRVH